MPDGQLEAQGRLEACVVNMQGMQSQYEQQQLEACKQLEQIRVKVVSVQQQRTEALEQFYQEEQELLSRLSADKPGVDHLEAVDRELSRCSQQRSSKQLTWHSQLEKLYTQWRLHEAEQQGWQCALSCLETGMRLNKTLSEAVERACQELREHTAERVQQAEEQFMRATARAVEADEQTIELLKSKRQRLCDTIESTQAVLNAEAPLTAGMNQVAQTLGQELESVDQRLRSLFMSSESQLEMVNQFGSSAVSISSEAIETLQNSLDNLLAMKQVA